MGWTKYKPLMDEAIANCPPYPAGDYAGDGIVTCPGGECLMLNAFVCISVLRELGCRLPIELWQFNRERDDRWERMFDHLDVDFRRTGVICDGLDDSYGRIKGWALKPYATLHSRFKRVLFLDADNIVARDPAYMFEWPEFVKRGAAFWPDGLWIPKATRWKQELVADHPQYEGWNFETGQYLIDKAICWREINLTMHMNEQAQFYYGLWYGDKETYHAAWLKFRTRWASTGFTRVEAHYYRNPDYRVLYQFDHLGGVLFQHRVESEFHWSRPTRKLPFFLHHDRCLELVQEAYDEFEEKSANLVASEVGE